MVKGRLCQLTDKENSSVESDNLGPCRPPLGWMTAGREMFALAFFQFYYVYMTNIDWKFVLAVKKEQGDNEYVERRQPL